MIYYTLFFAAFVASVSAQSGLSSGCINALGEISSNPDVATCLNTASLISLVVGASNSSVIPTIDSWLSGICSAPACSNATLNAVVTNVTAGCSADLSSSGISSDMSSSLASLIQQYYPTAREILCLKDGNINCITQTLTNIQNVTGNLTLSNVVSITNSPPNLPSNITCTNCVKAVYNTINASFPSFVSSAAPELNSQCGESFLDGTTPSGISQGASTSGVGVSSPSSNTTSNAGGVTPNSILGVTGLVALMTGSSLLV